MALIKIKQIDGLTGQISTFASADVSLATKISVDIAAANSSNAAGLSQEIVDRAAGDSTLSTNLSSEVSRATAAEGTF